MQEQPIVLVTGVSGQDGFYAARLFLKRGCRVVGTSRTRPSPSAPHLLLLQSHPLFQHRAVEAYTAPMMDQLILEVQPDRVFHGAGFRDIPKTPDEVRQCIFTNVELVDWLLNALERHRPKARFLFLSSAEIFERQGAIALDENAPRAVNNPYSAAKIEGMKLIKSARTRGLHASSAICFNHDSFLAPHAHLVRLVPRKLKAVAEGKSNQAVFYDTDILRDWSHASDFARAFVHMLEAECPQDLIVARGEPTRLSDYIELTCRLMRLDPAKVVRCENRKDQESYDRVGNSKRIKQELGWKPQVSLERLCREMIYWEWVAQ